MKTFGRAFAVWLVALLLCFLAANLTGLFRNMGLLPFRQTGFPFTFAVWGRTVEEFFDWNLLYLNALIAIGVSLPCAALLAWHRSRSKKTGGQNPKETNNTPQENP